MLKNILFLLAIILISIAGAQIHEAQLFPIELKTSPALTYVGTYAFAAPGAICTDKEMELINNTVKWSNWSWVMLAGNVASLPLTFALEDGTAGGILGIVTCCGWSLTHGFASFSYRDLAASQKSTGSKIPACGFARWSHVMGAAFGIGAITGMGLVLSDDTGVAIALTAICSSLSWISGIAGNIATYSHAGKVKRMARDAYGANSSHMLYAFPQESSKRWNGNGFSVKVPLFVVTF